MWRWYNPTKYPGDVEAVAALHRAMELRLGRKMDLPDLSREPIFAAVVREADGVVTHCLFLEAEAEACALGEEPLTARDAQQAVNEFLLPAANKYGLRIVRAFVPAKLLLGKKQRPGPVPRLLNKLGFTKEDYSMVQFFRWLVPATQTESESGKERPIG